MTTKPSANGSTVKPVETPSNGKVQTNVPVTKLPVKEEKPLDLDERLHKLDKLFELQGKYNRLSASQQKLAEFKLKKGSENITLSIYDESTRETFKTSNADVIKEVLSTVSTTINQKKKEIEPLLNW